MKAFYHYKCEEGWVPFELEKTLGEKWNRLCRMLLNDRPEDPHPNYDDYHRFMTDNH